MIPTRGFWKPETISNSAKTFFVFTDGSAEKFLSFGVDLVSENAASCWNLVEFGYGPRTRKGCQPLDYTVKMFSKERLQNVEQLLKNRDRVIRVLKRALSIFLVKSLHI